jgi:uncharacterized protein (TIGR02145 family)
MVFVLCFTVFLLYRCSNSSEEDLSVPDPISVSDVFTINSSGGLFKLPSGIVISVPEGAVDVSMELKIAVLEQKDASALGPLIIEKGISFLSGFSISTNSFDFKKPITIKIPVKDLDDNGLPVLYEFNKGQGGWTFSQETIIVSNEENYIELELKDLDQSGSRKESGSSFDEIRSFILKIFEGIFLEEEECKKKMYRAVAAAIDRSESEGCDVTTIQEDISYLECNPPMDEAFVALEISSLCEPQVDISREEDLKILKNDEIGLILTAHIGGLSQSGQEIKIVTNENLYVSKSTDFTDSEGKAEIKVTGIKAGSGLLSLTVSFDYYLSTIYASGAEEQEYHEYNRVQVKKDITLLISVYDKPEVFTSLVTAFDCKSAAAGGEVTDDGNSPITERGIYLNEIKYVSGSGAGAFTIDLNDLDQETEYGVRAYATNEAGTSFGEQISFTTLACSIEDMDGNVYHIVKIGEQIWMAENLKTTKYNDGSSIKNETDPWEWRGWTGSYCWYNNDITNKNIYGAIYNWPTVETGKLCPIGWHAPSTAEYITLIEFVGGIEVGGGKLKEKGTSHWESPNTGATDEYGFTALPGGIREGYSSLPGGENVDFWGLGEHGAWLTSTKESGGCFYYVGLSYDCQDGGMGRPLNCGSGASVRCVKD